MEVMLIVIAVLTLAGGLSYLFTKHFLDYSLRVGLLDVPNERSSHKYPTPRGGGVGFVAVFALAMVAASFLFSQKNLVLSFLPAIGISVLGFVDDKVNLSALKKLIIQSACSALFLFLLLGSTSQEPQVSLLLIVGFYWVLQVYLTNIYNFMDGIDGITAGNSLTVLAGLLILTTTGELNLLSFLGLGLIASLMGFLVFNWQPAKIFMGDVGSTFLGFIISGFIIIFALTGQLPLEASVIMTASFLVDSTYTLLVRLFSGKAIFKAHKDHVYQHLHQKGYAHSRVALGYMILNIVWLLPLAYIAKALSQPESYLLLLVAIVPLVIVCHYMKAGKTYTQEELAAR